MNIVSQLSDDALHNQHSERPFGLLSHPSVLEGALAGLDVSLPVPVLSPLLFSSLLQPSSSLLEL